MSPNQRNTVPPMPGTRTTVPPVPTTTSLPSAPPTELRPWGSFTVLEEGKNYKIKRIEVKPGHRLSLQMHYHRSEHWIVVSGTAKVTCGDKEILLNTNESTFVPPCTPHRLENPGLIDLVLIEVQNGQYLGEDDIVRFQDDYARVPANPAPETNMDHHLPS
ncbi:MAG: phosphomannose isomerase type II C-terminal cupin domain [Gloeomargarita sp. SKYG116]|nr:phosphomannose isomerase type II C-terminal cupin domain [Gloeomargarita sp. SKYG116]MDW8400839.1 phosphomannose isomerase type II C-terminal cupin domain [Gloeomargarita sp. SKYGB_i_bin116]